MFRPLRRVKNSLPEEAAKQLLRTERRGTLAVNGDDGYPYAIPVNFYYDEAANAIYIHGAAAGHKADSVRADDRVCFTVYGNEMIDDDLPWAPRLHSAVVFGRCAILTDREETIAKTRLIAEKYYPDTETVEEEIRHSGAAVQIYQITVEHLCGKQVRER